MWGVITRLMESNVVTDNGKASLTVIKTNEHGLQMDIIDNENITSNELNKGGLHLRLRKGCYQLY